MPNRPLTDHQEPADPRPLGRAARWAVELALGLRLAFTGGRDNRLRTALTALGVGLGVATLLLASSFPSVREHRDDRLRAQAGEVISPTWPSAPRTAC